MSCVRTACAPMSCTTFGCESAPIVEISRAKRCRSRAVQSWCGCLIATATPLYRARKTVEKPPEPARFSTRSWPIEMDACSSAGEGESESEAEGEGEGEGGGEAEGEADRDGRLQQRRRDERADELCGVHRRLDERRPQLGLRTASPRLRLRHSGGDLGLRGGVGQPALQLRGEGDELAE